jgi:hypothetical protein
MLRISSKLWMVASRGLVRSRDLLKGTNVKWAVNKFKPYKFPGPDGILAVLLQNGMDIRGLDIQDDSTTRDLSL